MLVDTSANQWQFGQGLQLQAFTGLGEHQLYFPHRQRATVSLKLRHLQCNNVCMYVCMYVILQWITMRPERTLLLSE